MNIIKRISIIILLFALLGTAYVGFNLSPMANQVEQTALSKGPCVFCNEAVLNYQEFYDGQLIMGLLNYRPILEGHALLIPKRHVERLEDLSAEEFAEIGEAIKKIHDAQAKVYKKNDFLLVAQNGKNGGQTVPHVHFHMIPRGSEWTVIIKAKMWLAFLTEVVGLSEPMPPLEMAKQTEKLHQALSHHE